MKTLVLLLVGVLLTFEINCKKHRTGYILKNNKDWPFLASIRRITDSGDIEHRCAGTLINQRWVLTSANCFNVYGVEDNWVIDLGRYKLEGTDSNVQSFKVTEIKLHPKYHKKSEVYSVALVKLEKPAKLNPGHVEIVPILSSVNQGRTLQVGDCCKIAGWSDSGYTGPYEVLRQVNVPILSQDTCKDVHTFRMTPEMICAGYQGPGIERCWGDNGGPLMCHIQGKMLQSGVVFFAGDCDPESVPSIYTNISTVLKFIEDNGIKLNDTSPQVTAPECSNLSQITTSTGSATVPPSNKPVNSLAASSGDPTNKPTTKTSGTPATAIVGMVVLEMAIFLLQFYS